jgi:peptide/nickel transport system substrate-binding protein
MSMSVSRRSLLALPAAGLAGPALAQSAATLRFVPHANLTVLDPIWTSAYITRNHAYLVYDTLYAMGSDLVPRPQMAEGMRLEDGDRVCTITLRPGLRFHDGEPVLARDCVASLKRWMSRDAFGQTLASYTDNLAALDDRRIVFRLKRPFSLLPDALARISGAFIMPERLARTDAFTQVRDATGSGPFRFLPDEWVPGASAAYARFDGYVPRDEAPNMLAGGKRARVDRVEWRIMPDAGTASTALQAGEVDWIEAPSADLLPLLHRHRRVTVRQIETFGSISMLRPNQLHPPFDNPAFRRALWSAIDQADVMTAVAGTDESRWRTGIGFFTPDTPMASTVGMEALTTPRNLDTARRAIEASGYRGEKLVFLAPTDLVTIDAMSHVVADLFRRLGLNVEHASTDWGTVVQRRANRGPVDQGGWSAFCTNVAAMECVNPATHSLLRGLGERSWFGWPNSPDIEASRLAWIEATGDAERKRLADDIQRFAFRDVPYYPLGRYWSPAAFRTGMEGFVPGPVPVAWNVSLPPA